ncbi:hypothetical protein [Vibrio owensii]|uniref:Uncharacterized protein n=1 Tax=Vibrio owensii CAIM 1854 = LMG 25443 TaxID=1229493 RepID=A0A0C1ZDG1_9VIBR|nr:hypothetical protein [Vibrio owensii]KIF54079.1 hypothetical protein H735_06735 [Vibrio owensii CAIM 1854 = LMG 25443]
MRKPVIYRDDKERSSWRRFAINKEIPQAPKTKEHKLLRKLFLALYRTNEELATEVTYEL